MIKQKVSIYLLLGIFILSMTCILGNRMPEISASTSGQTTIHHKIDESLENNKVYILNGFKYIYSSASERFTAMAADNPETITMIVFYEKINGKQAFYPNDLSLDSYTNLEDVVVFYAANVKTYLSGKTIKNLYMANQNNVTSNFSNFQVINYHFVSSYQALYTDITYLSTDYFNAMTITNAYYYEWNKHFFEVLADKYHASSGAIHEFKLRSESESSYTKESFYPFEDFESFFEKCGVKYYHRMNSSILPDHPTNETLAYAPYEIDERVKSITVPLLSSVELISTINYDTLDIRGYSLGAMSALSGETMIVSNSSSIFNTQYIRFKNLYFVYDPGGEAISSVTADIVTLEKIYIPEEHKSHFSLITSNDTLKDKVYYYSGEIKTDFKFTSTDKTKTYKSSSDFIDIDTVLESIAILENYGINIPSDCYINEFLEKYSLPTTKNETATSKYDLARFFAFTKDIDIQKAVKEMKDYMLYKEGIPCKENYTLEYSIKENNILEFTGIYPDGKEFSYLTEYKIITSEVGEFVGCDRLGDGDFTLMVEAKTIKEGVTAKDLMMIYIKAARQFSEEPVFKFWVTLTREGISTRESAQYLNMNEEVATAYGQVVITKSDLNPEGFKDPFYTIKDEYGKASILDLLKDKLGTNSAFKWISIGASSILGIILIYLVYILIEKGFKWLKR